MTKYALFLNLAPEGGQNTMVLDIDYPVSSLEDDNENATVNTVVSGIFDSILEEGYFDMLPPASIRRLLNVYVQEIVNENRKFNQPITYDLIMDTVIEEYELDDYFNGDEAGEKR